MNLPLVCELKLLWSERLAGSRLIRQDQPATLHAMYPQVEPWVLEHKDLPLADILAMADAALRLE